MPEFTYESNPDIAGVIWRRDHAFKAKDPKAKRKLCVVCGRGRNHESLCHFGAPPTINFGGSGFDFQSYQGIKQAWQKMLVEQLIESGLPRGLQRVVVEAEIGFDTYNARDEGNFRYFIEKALGDALTSGYWELWTDEKVEQQQKTRHECGLYPLITASSRASGKTRVQIHDGGWLPDDSFFPVARYSFGHLTPVYTPGQSHTRLTLFPGLEAMSVERGDQERLAV